MAPRIVHELDVVRPEEQPSRAVGDVAGGKIERMLIEPKLALVDTYRKRTRFTDEGEHERRVRLVVDLVRRAHLLDAAVAHHHDAVGELESFLLIVGDEHRRMSGLPVDFDEPASELFSHLCVERPERLIEEKQARLDGKRAGKGDALALTARKLSRIAILESAELYKLDEIECPLANLLLARALLARPHLEAKGDVAEDRHVAEQGVVLKDQPDIALLHGQSERVLAVEGHPP
jgi:hypothetical protein